MRSPSYCPFDILLTELVKEDNPKQLKHCHFSPNKRRERYLSSTSVDACTVVLSIASLAENTVLLLQSRFGAVRLC